MSCIENTMMSSPSMTRKIFFFFCFVAYCEKKCKKNGIEFKSRSFLLLTDLSTRKGKSGNKMKLKSLARASIMSYYMTSTDTSLRCRIHKAAAGTDTFPSSHNSSRSIRKEGVLHKGGLTLKYIEMCFYFKPDRERERFSGGCFKLEVQ